MCYARETTRVAKGDNCSHHMKEKGPSLGHSEDWIKRGLGIPGECGGKCSVSKAARRLGRVNPSAEKLPAIREVIPDSQSCLKALPEGFNCAE